jgi:HEAT repeat protein
MRRRRLVSSIALISCLAPLVACEDALSVERRTPAEWVAALQASGGDARASAVYELGRVGVADPRVVTLVARLLTDHDPGVRREAVAALVAVGRASARGAHVVRDAVVPRLRDREDSAARVAAANVLGGLGRAARGLAADLALASVDPSATVRGAAVAALGVVGDTLQRGTLVRALAVDPSPEVRAAAVQALATLSPANAGVVRAVRGALRDPSADVREEAVWAVAQVTPCTPAIVDDLVNAMGDRAGAVRGAAVQALGGACAHAVTSLAPLQAALFDSTTAVRTRAVAALERLTQQRLGSRTALTPPSNPADSGPSRQFQRRAPGPRGTR